MDIPEVTDEMMNAGREFDAALEELGFKAHQVFWGYDVVLGHHVLLIMTDFYDSHGPFAIMQLMFKAYNSSLLPQQIDPFWIRVHSIDQPLAQQIAELSKGGWAQAHDPDTGEVRAGGPLEFTGGTTYDVYVQRSWRVIERLLGHRAPESLTRQFKKFSDRVEKVAA